MYSLMNIDENDITQDQIEMLVHQSNIVDGYENKYYPMMTNNTEE